MLVWLTLPFYDFCIFRSVAVNSVYKLQFFYIYYTYTCEIVNITAHYITFVAAVTSTRLVLEQ